MAKKRGRKNGTLESTMPFPGHHPMIKGEPETRIKHAKMKRKKSSMHVNSLIRTGLVKGPLKSSGKDQTSRKRTTTKA